MLSQAVVNAKGEEYSWCLATITTELAALNEEEQDLTNSSDPTTDQEINADDDEEPPGQP